MGYYQSTQVIYLFDSLALVIIIDSRYRFSLAISFIRRHYLTRSITRLISPGFFVLIVVICLGSCAHFKTVNLNQIEEFAEMNCIKVTVPVKLEPNGIGTYIVVGTLCSTGDFEGKTLQVLLSGGGYGPVYFDCKHSAYPQRSS